MGSAVEAQVDGTAFDFSIADQENERAIRVGAHRALGDERHRLRPLVFALVLCCRLLILQKSDFHAHVRQNKVVFFQIDDGNAHFDGGLLAVGGGNDGANFRGNGFVRVGVQRRGNLLAVYDARDVRLVDVHFNFVRTHVHNRGNACPREPAAGRIWGHHLAHLSVLGNDNPRKWCANRAIVHRLLGDANTRFGCGYLLLGEVDFGLEAVYGGGGVVESLLSLHAGLLQLFSAAQRNLSIPELHFIVGNGSFGGVAVGFGRIERPLDVRIIQCGEQLALGHPRAFIEENPGDAAGNLGGDGGAAAGGDVAAGIQQRLASARIGLRGSRYLHHWLLTTQRIGARDNAREDEDRDRGIENALAHLRLAPLPIVDAQRAKVRFCRDLWTSHQRPLFLLTTKLCTYLQIPTDYSLQK